MGEIRFVGTGETRRYPYLVSKKRAYLFVVAVTFEFLRVTIDGIARIVPA